MHWSQFSDWVDGCAMALFLFWFCFGTACVTIIFVVVTGTTTTGQAAEQALRGLSFFDVCGTNYYIKTGQIGWFNKCAI